MIVSVFFMQLLRVFVFVSIVFGIWSFVVISIGSAAHPWTEHSSVGSLFKTSGFSTSSEGFSVSSVGLEWEVSSDHVIGWLNILV